MLYALSAIYHDFVSNMCLWNKPLVITSCHYDFVFIAVDADHSPQQVVVVLAEYKSMLFHQWIPSVEEQGPGLDCGWGPEELSDSIGQNIYKTLTH